MENRYLYRGKQINNGEWVVGNRLDAQDGRVAICETNGNWKGICPCIPDTVCQCTGLKDKNDKLIWENDICDRKEQYPEIVEYRDGDWTLDYSYVSHKERGACYCNLGFYAEERKCVEVIGNIFDNPELLEVQE